MVKCECMKSVLDEQLAKKKYQKELSIARATIEGYVKSVLPAEGLAYSLRDEDNGVILRIRLEHRRMIQVKLTRTNYVKILQRLLPVIQRLREEFDEIGKMNIKVMGYNWCIDWVEPEM